MKDALVKLLKVKSLITISVTAVFCVLALKGVINPEMFMSIFAVIVAFYFGTQTAKKGGANE